ncbi:hypothetical protein DV736_g3646, partial [Chaetothyriales sp. CBS 134916]
MSSNVGLSTPRGSGTSGYVQRNLSLLKPRDAGYGAPYPPTSSAPKHRKPDRQILKHDREREVEVKVLELRDKLEDDGKLDDEEIDEACEKLRIRLLEEAEAAAAKGKGAGVRKMKGYQVHEMAEAKERESERLRKALGLGRDRDGEEEEHPMARQERKRREKELGELSRDERQDRVEKDEKGKERRGSER